MSKMIVALCLATIILVSTAASSWFLLPRHEGDKLKAKSLVTFDVDRFSDPKDKNSAVRGGWYVNITATRAKISFDQIVVVVFGPDMHSPINWSWLILEPKVLNESDGSVVYAQDSRIIFSDSPLIDELVNISKRELDNLSGDLRSYDHMSMVYRDVQNDYLMNVGDSFYFYRDNDADGRVEVPSGSIFTLFVYHENDIHFRNRIFITNLTLTWPTTCGVNELIC